jgi:hypothetical protein
VGELTLNDGESVDVDMSVIISEDYTTESSTSQESIFDGRIEDYDFSTMKNITVIDRGEELMNIIPNGLFAGLTGEVASLILDYFTDHIYADYTPIESTGYFKAPYNFRLEQDLTDEDISIVDEAEYQVSCTVESSIGDHNNVLKLYNAGGPNTKWRHYHKAVTSGTVEFWYRTTDDTKDTYIRLSEGDDGYAVVIKQDSGYIQYYEDGVGYQNLYNISNNTWYRLRVDFDCSTDTYDIYIYNASGTELNSETDVAFIAARAQIDRFESLSTMPLNTYYLDAI